jgi:hypothetical protein
MTVVVISQPMLFPWVGLFEQLATADVYVHLTDVQWSKGSFVNRVQIKTADGPRWLTVPVVHGPLATSIRALQPTNAPWRTSHLETLERHYGRAPFGAEMLDFVRTLYATDVEPFSAFLQCQFEAVGRRLGVADQVEFVSSEDLVLASAGSDRVLDIVHHFGGSTYVTGHGARNYLDHERFEAEGVEVRYLDYAMTPYPQWHGEFTPYVSVLDLIAHVGFSDAHRFIAPRTVHWREFCAPVVSA